MGVLRIGCTGVRMPQIVIAVSSRSTEPLHLQLLCLHSFLVSAIPFPLVLLDLSAIPLSENAETLAHGERHTIHSV